MFQPPTNSSNDSNDAPIVFLNDFSIDVLSCMPPIPCAIFWNIPGVAVVFVVPEALKSATFCAVVVDKTAPAPGMSDVTVFAALRLSASVISLTPLACVAVVSVVAAAAS